MAQLELRNATVYIQDGFSAAAAVNFGAGYAAGISSIVMDAATATIPELASFYVDGDDQMHIVTATNGSTTMTFTPALTEAIVDDAVITFGGRTLEVKIGEGNATYNETRNIEYVLDRQSLSGVREGDDVPIDVSLEFVWDFLTGADNANPTIEDAIRQRGEAADWVSTDPDACQLYAVDIVIEHVPPCGADGPEVVRLPDFRWEGSPHDLRAATVSITGKCNAKEAIVSRPVV